MDEHVHWRAKVAYMYTISQMLIYNTYNNTITRRRPQYQIQKSMRHPFSSTKALICMEMHDWEKKQMKKSHELGGVGGGKGKTTTSGCHTGQHSMMPVKHVPYFYTVVGYVVMKNKTASGGHLGFS